MDCKQSLDRFIIYLAQKIATIYPSNYADKEDYIQEGHLKLAEIHRDKQEKHNFLPYAIVTIARAMRYAAINAMYAVSAPQRVKKQVHKIKILLALGRTEQEICQELKITESTLISLRSLINTESWHRLFEEPTLNPESFSVFNDLLSSDYLTEEDRVFIQVQFNDTTEDLGLSRKQQWKRNRDIRPKLVRSGYGI